jgi:hypothetical protein
MSTLVEQNEIGLTRTATKLGIDLLRNIRDASSFTGSVLRTGKSKVEKHELIERTKDGVEAHQYIVSLPQDEQEIALAIKAEIKAFNS